MGISERRQREREERRNQIIRAARKEFAKSGVRNASIKEIARNAELSPRTVHIYFRNKRELYGAVLLSGLKILWKEIENISLKEEDPFEAIELVKKTYGNFYNEHRDYFRIMMFVGFHDIYKEVRKELCEEISEAVVGCITAVSGVIERGQKEGIFYEGNPMKLSWVLWTLFVGIGHLNEARGSLNVGEKDFASIFDFAYKAMMFV